MRRPRNRKEYVSRAEAVRFLRACASVLEGKKDNGTVYIIHVSIKKWNDEWATVKAEKGEAR